jgi:hypothetical protein
VCSVVCVHLCLCFWIVHSWSSLRFPLKIIFPIYIWLTSHWFDFTLVMHTVFQIVETCTCNFVFVMKKRSIFKTQLDLRWIEVRDNCSISWY